MHRALRAAWLAIREATSRPSLSRNPEPSAEMTGVESVRGFHDAGGKSGPLLGIYHFNARAIHQLVPRGGIVLDLGCGSGQFLAYLARRRPDLKLIGLDLSREMIALGNEMLSDEGLSHRVELRKGDMTNFMDAIPGPVDLISSVFSLHHLPSRSHLDACAGELRKANQDAGTAIWIFDHARPRREVTADRFPHVFTPDASSAFKLDSSNSLKASWSFKELRGVLQPGVSAHIESALARWLPLYQIHWLERRPIAVAGAGWHAPDDVPRAAIKDADVLASLLGGPPGARNP
ncbi:MAG: class I SAM-dependent methyltransferase [Betaproteobacteria bacterium]|nr:MAG: class I SAM-dependent methyltransferase [Betaproteobacteria bacterium]